MVGAARFCSSVLIVGSVLGACSSNNAVSNTSVGSTNVTVPAPGDTQATQATIPGVGANLCDSIPDLAAIEAAIGVAVKSPLGVGEMGAQQSCNLLRATDDFPGIVFTATPGRTIGAQIDFVSTNFGIDIVPLEGEAGFYKGEGDSVYYELNGTLYQTSATIDGDSRAASVNLMKLWLGL